MCFNYFTKSKYVFTYLFIILNFDEIVNRFGQTFCKIKDLSAAGPFCVYPCNPADSAAKCADKQCSKEACTNIYAAGQYISYNAEQKRINYAAACTKENTLA